MKLKLPKIKPRPSKEVFITTSFFSNLKQKYKSQEEQLLTEVIPEVKFDFEKDLEKKDDKILYQKQLSDLYSTDFSLVYDDMQKSYMESKKAQEKTDKNEVNKQKINKIYNTEGFEDFFQTKYVNKLSMLEFFNKYSKFNSLYRKYQLTKKK